jgi:hypothetical protein
MGMPVRFLLALLLIAPAPVAFACSPGMTGDSTSTDAKQIGWMSLGKDAVKERLRDPQSRNFAMSISADLPPREFQ